MKTIAVKEKRFAPAARKSHQYVHHTMGPLKQAQQAEVRRILHSTGAQAKLAIGQPNDKYEQEADHVSDQIMQMPTPQPAPVSKTAENIHKKAEPGIIPLVTSKIAYDVNDLRNRGQPLPESTRHFFEPRFGADFSGVRVHVGQDAANSARTINARAYTIGHDIVFGTGEYAPGTTEGNNLLAHELTHVMQQGASNVIRRQNVRTPAEEAKVNVALASPWDVAGVKEMLNMSTEGQAVLSSLEAGLKLFVCDDIQATQKEIFVDDPQAATLSAMKIIDQIIANTIQVRNVISTDVPKPTFNGHSNKKDQTVFVKLALSNFDAAATIIHESMHLQPHAGLSRKEEEDLIRTTVSQLRSNMGNALKLTDPEKAQSALPSVSLTKKQREAVVAKSEHYNPTKTHIANNEYKITIFVPRVVRETLFSGFIPVP